VKERLVICNEEDTDGRAKVTTHGASSACSLGRDQAVYVVRLTGCENFTGE